jgi:hypothetical protein
MRLAGHVACMGEKRNTYIILVGKPDGKRTLAGPLDIDERIILKCISEK